jgi:hypothetical protein
MLCGSSGCGKSTAVELICKENNIHIVTWGEESWEMVKKSSGLNSFGSDNKSSFKSNNEYLYELKNIRKVRYENNIITITFSELYLV